MFTYRVDANNRIISVTREWESFAQENDAPELVAAAVLGKPLLDFVAGMEAQHLYELIIARVRRTQQAVAVPFRCDSPSVRRFMELRISSYGDNHLELEGRILREEERGAVSLLDSSTSRSDEFLTICSWCKQVDVSGEWLEVEEAVKRRRFFNSTTLPQLTHGICNACEDRVRGTIDGEFAS